METEKIIRAGKIASEVKKFAKSFVKKDMPLLEIAEKIEAKISELGGKPAFPTNLSINNVAAHYTPGHDDETKAGGLLKVDFGVHVDGWTADNAFSLDLENSEENKKIIAASEEALKNALGLIKKNFSERAGGQRQNDLGTRDVGKTVQETIESHNLSPVINLSGHSMDQYDLHSGINVPNIGEASSVQMKDGLYAIEPFATNGSGRVRDGKPSGIYQLQNEKNVRSPIAREVLKAIIEEYNTLPFCSRWLVKKLGTKALFGLNQLEENGNLHHFAQLVEEKNSLVSQSEETILISEGKVVVTTE